jgi:hypothetical protein
MGGGSNCHDCLPFVWQWFASDHYAMAIHGFCDVCGLGRFLTVLFSKTVRFFMGYYGSLLIGFFLGFLCGTVCNLMPLTGSNPGLLQRAPHRYCGADRANLRYDAGIYGSAAQ